MGVSFSFLPRSMRNVKSWLTVPGREGGRHQMAREGGLGRADGLARQAEVGRALPLGPYHEYQLWLLRTHTLEA